MNNNNYFSPSKIRELIDNHNVYKSSSNMTQTVRRNNDLYEGKNVRTFFKTIPNLNFNYSKTIVDNFISTVSDYNPKIYCDINTFNKDADELDIALMEKAINSEIQNVLNSNNNVILNVEMCKRACIDGTAFIHIYFQDKVNNTIFDNTSVDKVGRLKMELLDVLKVSVSNIYSYDIQDNDWVGITDRIRIEELKQIARTLRDKGSNTLTDEEIERLGKQVIPTEAYINVQDNFCDIVLFYFKDYKTNTIHKKIVDLNSLLEITSDVDLSITQFPIASFNWNSRKNSYYGQSPLDDMAQIQTLINVLAAITCMQEVLDIPRLVVNSRKINTQTISNDPGEIIVTNSSGTVNNDIMKLQSSNQASNRFAFISILRKELMDIVGYNALDISKITFDSSKSLIFAQDILNKPLSNVKKMYSYTMQSIGRIIVDFYINYFRDDAVKNIRIKNDAGENIIYPLDLSILSDVTYNFSVKHSTSSVYNDDNTVATLLNFVNSGLIQLKPEDLIKLIPQNVLSMKDDVLEILHKYEKQAQEAPPQVAEDGTILSTSPEQPNLPISIDDAEIQDIFNSISNE